MTDDDKTAKFIKTTKWQPKPCDLHCPPTPFPPTLLVQIRRARLPLFRLLRPHGVVVGDVYPGGDQLTFIQNDIWRATLRQLHRFAALHKAKWLAMLSGELRQIVRVGFQIQTALRVHTKHQTIAVNTMHPENAAGGDLAETGEHLVQKLSAAMIKATQCVAFMVLSLNQNL